jgi:hypothetical protein
MDHAPREGGMMEITRFLRISANHPLYQKLSEKTLSSGEDFDGASEARSRKSKPEQYKKILVFMIVTLGFIGVGYFMVSSNFSGNGETEKPKPTVASSLTPEQKEAVAQANKVGDRVLSDCTPVLPSGSHDCNTFVKQLVDTCNTELKDYFKYCSDARLQGYLSSVGGYEVLEKNYFSTEAS